MFEDESASTHPHEDRSRHAILSAGIGMAIVDMDGRWVEVNPAFERMFGHQAADLIGRATVELAHPEDLAAVRMAFERVRKGETPALDAQHRFLHRTGAIVWAQANVAMMHDDAGQPNYLVVHLRDISGEREAERALQALNQTLQQRVAEGTAALQGMSRHQEAFAYGISHDLRAPLRAIDSFAALLDDNAGEALDEAGRAYLARIRAAATRMGQLIDALLDLSRASRTEMKSEPVDLSLLAEWTGAELQDAEPGRAAEIDVAPGLLVAGDERQLKLMLAQLFNNAWKFSRDRESVRIEVLGDRAGDRLHMSIRDHGAGFDMRYADKLFEPFQRLHHEDEGGGNGIGLAIAHCIVERHGGRIRAESEPGQGSTFHLDLPAATVADPESNPDESPA
ncbi:MAG: sensor histidine kinase [Luteimonas sp.]